MHFEGIVNAAAAAAAAAKSLQSCPTLCDPIDGSLPASAIPGILQARTLEWVAISFSSAWKWKVKVKSLSHVWLFVTPWTVAYQAPLSMGFSRQEYWSGFPLSSEIFLQGKMIKLINKISDRKVYLILWMRMLLVVWGMSRRLSDCYIRKDEWVQGLFGRIIWQGMVTHSAKKMGR